MLGDKKLIKIYQYILIYKYLSAILLLNKLNLGDIMNKSVFKTTQGVKIDFTGAVKKEQIVQMVENCSTGACECMSSETKEKIKDMSVSGEDGAVELNLIGDMSKEDIENALSKSKALETSCC